MQNLSCENEFYLQFHFHATQSHFHKNGFALRLALKQRHKGLGNELLDSALRTLPINKDSKKGTKSNA